MEESGRWPFGEGRLQSYLCTEVEGVAVCFQTYRRGAAAEVAFVDSQLCSAAVTASSLNRGRLSAVCTPMGSTEGGGDLRKESQGPVGQWEPSVCC